MSMGSTGSSSTYVYICGVEFAKTWYEGLKMIHLCSTISHQQSSQGLADVGVMMENVMHWYTEEDSLAQGYDKRRKQHSQL